MFPQVKMMTSEQDVKVSALLDTRGINNHIAEVVLDYSVDEHIATAGAPVDQSESNYVVEPVNVSQRGNAVSPQQQTENSMLYASAEPPEHPSEEHEDQPPGQPRAQTLAQAEDQPGEQPDAQPGDERNKKAIMY